MKTRTLRSFSQHTARLLPLLGLTLAAGMVQAQSATNFRYDLRYDQNCYLTTHNSYANGDDGYILLTAQQRNNIVFQLERGTRALSPDTWLLREHESSPGIWAIEIYKSTSNTTPSDDFKNDTLKVALCHHPDEVYAGHALLSKDMPFPRFADELNAIHSWMTIHPTEVVTLVLESYVGVPSLMMQEFKDAGLDSEIFYCDRPNVGFPAPDGSDWDVRLWGWPTLKQMAQYKRRLVVVSSNGVHSDNPNADDGLPYQWGPWGYVENVDSDDCLDTNKTAVARGESAVMNNMTHPLLFMNFYPTLSIFGPDWTTNDPPFKQDIGAGIVDYTDTDSYTNIRDCANAITHVAQRYPNFVNVNFEETGLTPSWAPNLSGPEAAVSYENFLWQGLPGYTATQTPAFQPNKAGWYHKKLEVTLSGQGTYNDNGVTRPIGHSMVLLKTLHADGGIATQTLGGSATYEFGEGIWHGTVTAIGSYPLQHYFTGFHQLRSDAIGYQYKVDLTPPTTTATLDHKPNAASWYNKPVQVTLTAKDSLSGVQKTFFSRPGGPWQTYGGHIGVDGNGRIMLHFYSTDNADNAEPIHDLYINLDETPPVVTATLDGVSGGTKPITLHLKASDSLSGVKSVTYQVNNQSAVTVAGSSVDQTFTQPGTYTVTYSSVDNADNKSLSKHLTFTIKAQ